MGWFATRLYHEISVLYGYKALAGRAALIWYWRFSFPPPQQSAPTLAAGWILYFKVDPIFEESVYTLVSTPAPAPVVRCFAPTIYVTEYEKRKGSQVARHHIKDHRAKQLLVVPNDDKFVAVAAPEAFSRHSGTCMILGGQVGLYGSQNAVFLIVPQFLVEL